MSSPCRAFVSPRLFCWKLVCCLLCLGGLLLAPAMAGEVSTPSDLKQLKYRLIGPKAGGRVCRVAGVPGDPAVYYAATAGGGVWKSTDGGINWSPIFDEQPDSSIGSIAVAPSNPNILYVGAGEANIRGNVIEGHGIYKSTDGGKTWKHVWKQRGQIGTMIVHPANADVAFAAVLGHAFGANPERGIYRTTDGGKTWQKVLYKDTDSGASDVCFDPSNPQILFAGFWETRRYPWDLKSGGPGSGLYVSRDGGDTWTQLGPKDATASGGREPAESAKTAEDAKTIGKGLPPGPYGRIGVAVAPSDGRRVYALIEADKGGLYRSDDGGDTWQLATADRNLRQRAWYYTTLTIDPKNADVIWAPNIPLLKSIDGGKTFKSIQGPHHVDHHDLWIDPQNPKRMIDGNDGGVDVTVNGGETWYAPNLPITQFYHIACDNRLPYHVSGTKQDLGTSSGPSNSLSFSIGIGDWHSVAGGECGFTAPDPSDPNIVYAGNYGGLITRYDHRTKQARNVSIYPVSALGKGADALKHRFQWVAPIHISPHDPKTVYHAAEILFKTTDGGQNWKPISTDLTRNDKGKQKWAGGPITGDNTGAEVFCTIFAVAESPRQKDLIWVGTDDGLVQVSQNGGRTWTNVAASIPGLPEWGTVKCVEPSPFDAGTAYVVVDNRRLDDPKPYLFKTSDLGKTWKNLAGPLPQDACLHVVREDPKRKGLLYAGSDEGVLYSPDDGTTWHALKLNLPTVPVHDLVVKNGDLVVGTHGRSIWILDDLSPIRELTSEVTAKAVHLLPAQEAIRWRYGFGNFGPTAGTNPPRGAILHYFLKEKAKGEITLEVLDANDRPVAKMSSKAAETPAPEGFGRRFFTPRGRPTTDAGINRVVWDLAYDGAKPIKGAKSRSGGAPSGPTVLPGTYKIRLTANGQTQTTTVVVKQDPRVDLPASEMQEQLKLALALRDQLNQLAEQVESVRTIRQQLTQQGEVLKGQPKTTELVKLGKDIVAKLDALEDKLHLSKAEIPNDVLRLGGRLYDDLGGLYSTVMRGDGAPTQGMRESHDESTRALDEAGRELGALIAGDLARFNTLARSLDVPNVVAPGKRPGS